MALYLTLGTLLLTLLICKLIHGWIFGKKMMQDIPGPQGWPLFGNSLQMDPTKPHETLTDWCQLYGNIFKIKIFQDDVVVLNDFESIKEMLMSKACSARPYYVRHKGIIIQDWKDIAFQVFTPQWNERKKALTRSLNAYGAGQKKIEAITVESINKMFTEIRDETEHYTKSIDMKPVFHKCTAGMITTLLYGRRLEEPELLELLEMERGMLKLISPTGLFAILEVLPWLRHFQIKAIQGPIDQVTNFRKWIRKMHAEMVKYSEKDEVEGIYFSLMTNINKVTKNVMTQDELMGVSADTVLGGFVTSTATLYSLVLILVNYPELQERIHEEINQVTKGRQPQMSDCKSMPFVRAVMEENLRYSTTGPVGFPHFTSVDTMINGKFIPKGITLFTNIWKLHHDEEYFEDPWKFKPERFLTSDGQIVPTDHPIWKYTLPFSAGRRICPGEGLARKRMFLILSSLIQRYKFLPEDDENIPSCDPHNYESAPVLLPCQYKVRISER